MKLLPAVLAALLVWTPACAQVETPENATYVASSRGQVYYPVWCEAWRSLSPSNLRWFASADQAENAGYARTTHRACAAADPAASALYDGGTCTVVRIVDADTVLCSEGDERVRLLLIDSPETSQGDYGRLAREALQRLLPTGARTRVELDVQARDRYGRVLAYLHTPDGIMVNEELARLGFALVSIHPPNVRHVERIRAAAADARSARRGLWSGSAYECAPADHRAGRC